MEKYSVRQQQKWKVFLIFFILAILIIIPKVHATSYQLDNTGNSSETDVCCFGGTGTYGQTITVPETHTILNSAEFYINAWPTDPIFAETGSLSFTYYLAEWEEGKTSNTAIYSGSKITVGPNQQYTYYQPVTFDFEGLQLIGNSQYIIFATVLPEGWTGQLNGQWLATRQDQLTPNDGFYYTHSYLNFTDLTSAIWNPVSRNPEDFDLKFKANFNSEPAPVPEPSTIYLVGTALFGMFAFGRKKLFKK